MDVEHFDTIEEAYLFKARKEAEGYHAFVLDEYLPYGMPFPSVRVTYYPKRDDDRKTIDLPEGYLTRGLEFGFKVSLMTSLLVAAVNLLLAFVTYPVASFLVLATAVGILALPLILYTWIAILCEEGVKPLAFRILVCLILFLPLLISGPVGGL